jgi:hypothetical protein
MMAYSSSVKVPEFKGKAYRKLKLHEMGPDVLEGMDLLEERRAQKWIKESEERSKRRLQGIMYDEVGSTVCPFAFTVYLFRMFWKAARRFVICTSASSNNLTAWTKRLTWFASFLPYKLITSFTNSQLWWTIIGSIFFGACAFIFVRMRLVKKRRQLMLERKARSLEERKRRERLAREQAGLKLAQ